MKKFSMITVLIFIIQLKIFAQEGWIEQTSGTIEILNSVYFIDNDNGFIVGNRGTFLKTTDAGENWISHSTGTNEQINAVQFLNQNIGFAVANLSDSAWVMKTTDGGENWVTQILNPTYPILYLQTIQFTDSNIGWTAGQRGDWDSSYAVLYKTTDGGSVWFEVTTPISSYYSSLSSLHFTDSDNGWITGWWKKYDSTGYLILPIFRTTDGGESWINQSIYTGSAWDGGIINSVYFVNESVGWVVGVLAVQTTISSRIYKTTDGGSNWIEQNHPTYPFLYLSSVFFIDESTGWTVSRNPPYVPFYIILYTTNGGADWIEQVQDVMISLIDVFFVDENNGWAVGDSGKIVHTTNGGVTFVEEKEIDELPTDYHLIQNYPNPFNPSTKISWQSPLGSWQTLKVYDVLGNEVATLVDGYKPAGSYEVEFNSHSGEGRNLTSGIYFYRLQAGEFIETRKMVLLK